MEKRQRVTFDGILHAPPEFWDAEHVETAPLSEFAQRLAAFLESRGFPTLPLPGGWTDDRLARAQLAAHAKMG